MWDMPDATHEQRGGQRQRRMRRPAVLLCAALSAALIMLGGAGFLRLSPVASAAPGRAARPAAATQLLQDGGFEASPSPWQTYSKGGFQVIDGANPHTGSGAFYACDYPGCDDRVWQTVTVPATVSSATLTFWLDASPAAVNIYRSACLDQLAITFGSPTSTTAVNIGQAACHPTRGYVLVTYNVTSALAAYAGQQVVVTFRATAANLTSGPSSFSFWIIDDVSLLVS